MAWFLFCGGSEPRGVGEEVGEDGGKTRIGDVTGGEFFSIGGAAKFVGEGFGEFVDVIVELGAEECVGFGKLFV